MAPPHWLLQAGQIQALLLHKQDKEVFHCGSWPLGLLCAHTTPSVRAMAKLVLAFFFFFCIFAFF